MRKILATGTSGTLGKHLSKDFVKLEIDLASPFSPGFPFDSGEDFDLLHLAGVVGEENVRKDCDYSERVNVQSTGELAERFRDTSKGKFVYVSTSHVYAKSTQPIHEDYMLEPTSTYADQKLRAEMYLTSVFKDDPQRLLIIRVFSILDWGMPAKTLGATIESIKNNIPDVKIKNADDVRDFLTPLVVGRTISALVQEFTISGCINLCSGLGTSVRNATIQMLGSNVENPETHLIKGNSLKPTIVGSNSRLIALDPRFRLSWDPGQH